MNEFQRRIGVGEPSRAFSRLAGTTRRRPVVMDDGPARGKVGGFHTDHWDGRVDATVRPQHVHHTISKHKETP